ATRHDETRQDTTGASCPVAPATEMVASVSEAARLLGLTEGAVRKRIERGQLRAAKVKNQWQITIGTDDLAETALRDATRRDETGHDTTDTTEATRHDETDRTSGTVAPAAVAQLEAIRDQWLQPLVDRIGTLEREAGRLQAERDAALAEVERLKAVQDAAVAAQEPQHEAQPAEMVSDASASPRPLQAAWWRRLLGLDR
ncbi:MAG: helix-turn-helix domain-containing protein, partial [Chloroflexota bacterium]|nr:helix-turn-helix domain-containing protein [Chloroflexota bacterium]